MAFQVRIDTGGTFTDCWGKSDSGEVRTLKILSSGRLRLAVEDIVAPGKIKVAIPPTWTTPCDFFVGYTLENHLKESGEVLGFDANQSVITCSQDLEIGESIDLYSGEEAPVVGARLLTGTNLDEAFPKLDFRLATTRGTNALLERKGAPLALFINSGFGDLLQIGDQRRPDLFALNHVRPKPIHEATVELEGRINHQGEVESPLDLNSPELRKSVQELLDRGITIAAVALLHSYRNPEHEIALRDFLLASGFTHVSISSALAPLIKILPRTQTAVTNAYLHPVMQTFLDHIEKKIGDQSSVFTMTSAGGLEPVSVFRPKDSLLSGPAGGVAGAAAVARELGFERIITFDMGGTSTDVARYDGDFIYHFEQRVGDARLLGTSLKIETVAAGGGSICRWVGEAVRVGPESAGAFPGPACYGQGGPLTITDLNLLLGRIDIDNFGIPLHSEQVEQARRRALELQEEAGLPSRELDTTFLGGLIEIAVEQMADAIRTISIRDGADPSDYALLAFGGAGPLHACAIAEKLEIETIIVPGDAGVLSAYGLEKSSIERIAEIQVNELIANLGAVQDAQERVARNVRELFDEIDMSPGRIRFLAELCFTGQDSNLTIEFEKTSQLSGRFIDAYLSIFGYQPPGDRQLEVVSIRAVATSEDSDSSRAVVSLPEGGIELNSDDYFLDKQSLSSDNVVSGPRVIQDPFSTLFLPENWAASVSVSGSVLVKRKAVSGDLRSSDQRQHQGVASELFRHRLDHVVEEMGAMLQRSAISTNVKERLDFSCALLDQDGKLVASANHIPVHLGAMGLCVRSVMDRLPIRPGDTIITNHPADGGSHLPDITLVTPIFENGSCIAFVANRAHHAELGGIAPGSMPPGAVSLEEEGVVIPAQYLIAEGVSRFAEIESVLTNSPYPTRRLTDNLADLHAQVAANLRGVSLVGDLLALYEVDQLRKNFVGLAGQNKVAMARHIATTEFQSGASKQRLDDGTLISVSIEKCEGSLKIDLEGTSLTHSGNLNAPPAIVRSAILYVLQLWTQNEGSLNEGLLDLVDIVLPPCFLNPVFQADPAKCPAVVGGNVETSQRLVDTLIEALQLQACSQGTMNNFLFGDDTFGYYETIAGGAGAGRGYHGASGIHTHMTNTAITDPEILESRYPVQLNEFSIRRNSGGKGKWQGGDGLIREITFQKPVRVSLLVQHRKESPFGLEGGKDGQCGRQLIDGEEFDASGTIEVSAGQTLRIETPGGGGGGRSS